MRLFAFHFKGECPCASKRAWLCSGIKFGDFQRLGVNISIADVEWGATPLRADVVYSNAQNSFKHCGILDKISEFIRGGGE